MKKQNPKTTCLMLTATIMACACAAKAQDQTNAPPAKMGDQMPGMTESDQIKDLQKRLADLEAKSATVGGTNDASKAVSWLSQNQISGFVSGSYLHNFNHSLPTTGRSFDVNENFSLNKLKLVLQNPASASPDKWSAGYRADVIVGQDAQLIQSAGLGIGDYFDVEQLYATINVPIGKGLLVDVGKKVTLMGVEVIEETANPNWSEGNQFLLAENFTSTGVQLTYQWTDKLDTEFRVNNGWDDVKDNNKSLSYMGRIGYVFNTNANIGVVGYAGPEEPGNNSAWREGVNVVFNYKFNSKLNSYVQLDYGHEDANPVLPKPGDAKWYAAGLWVTYDFTDKIELALRADDFDDVDGARTSGGILAATGTAIGTPYPVNTGQNLTSLTMTLNTKPFANFQFRPEVRWDHSDLAGAFSGRKNQFTVGFGVAYLF
jgi:hypothetical protein